MKNCYFWATPSGPINLMKAEDMPVHPNNRVQVQRHEAEIRVIKDGEVVWQRDARADDYAWSNAENHAHHLKVKLMSEYESTLQAAKESSVPIQDQLRARKMCMLFGEIKPDTIYGPFSLRYEIQNTAIVSQNIAGMNVDVKQIAILYDDTPEKEESHEDIQALADAAYQRAKEGNMNFWSMPDDDPEVLYWKKVWTMGYNAAITRKQ